MRVLTVRQPWAWAIIHAGKDVENRVRHIAGDYRGPVAIHTGLRWDPTAYAGSRSLQQAYERYGITPMNATGLVFPVGVIIGVVDLIDVHQVCGPPFPGGEWPLCSTWAEADAWHLVLANPRPLPEPIPFKGALGLRELPAEVESALFFRRRAIQGVS